MPIYHFEAPSDCT